MAGLTFNTEDEILGMLKLRATGAVRPVLDKAVLGFRVAVGQVCGMTPEAARTAFPLSADKFKLAEVLYVQSEMLPDLQTFQIGSSTSPQEVWNEEPATRVSRVRDEAYDLRDRAMSLLYDATDGIDATKPAANAAVIGSDDSCVHRRPSDGYFSQ